MKLAARKIGHSLIAIVVLGTLSGCGGTWVDESGNFKRVFGFAKPADVQVLHSYYWKSPHWTTEYRYYIELRGPQAFANARTDKSLATPAMPSAEVLQDCLADRPAWFLPKPLNHYDMWLPLGAGNYRILRDNDDGTLYACDQQL